LPPGEKKTTVVLGTFRHRPIGVFFLHPNCGETLAFSPFYPITNPFSSIAKAKQGPDHTVLVANGLIVLSTIHRGFSRYFFRGGVCNISRRPVAWSNRGKWCSSCEIEDNLPNQLPRLGSCLLIFSAVVTTQPPKLILSAVRWRPKRNTTSFNITRLMSISEHGSGTLAVVPLAITSPKRSFQNV